MCCKCECGRYKITETSRTAPRTPRRDVLSLPSICWCSVESEEVEGSEEREEGLRRRERVLVATSSRERTVMVRRMRKLRG